LFNYPKLLIGGVDYTPDDFGFSSLKLDKHAYLAVHLLLSGIIHKLEEPPESLLL